MRDFLAKVDRDGERWLLLVLYSTIVVTIAMEVIRRFVLSYSSIWGEEVARYAFIYLAWIGASAAIRNRAHMRIDVILHYVPPKAKSAIYLFGDICTLILAIIALYWSIEPVITSIKFGSVTHGLRISQAWFLAAVPLGFSLMTLRLLQSIWRDVHGIRTGKAVYEGEKLFD